MLPPPDKCSRARDRDPSDASAALPDFTGRTIQVQVGAEFFNFHENVISKSSDFFKAEAGSDGDRKPIDLGQGSSCCAFKLYLGWLYSGNIRVPKGSTRAMKLPTCYLLGLRVLDKDFQNVVFKRFVECCSHSARLPSHELINDVYRMTGEEDPMRRLLVDLVVWTHVNTGWWAEVKVKPDEGPKSDILDGLYLVSALIDDPPWINATMRYNIV